MLLTPRSVTLLKNFAAINPAIRVVPGNILETVDPAQTIIARARTDMQFPAFALQDLSKVLNVVALFQRPEIEFEERTVTIHDSTWTKAARFFYADPEMVVAPKKNPRVSDPDVEFTLSEEDFAFASKAVAVLRVPDFLIVGDGKEVTFGAADSQNVTSTRYTALVGETKLKFRAVLKSETILKILPDCYTVRISLKGITHWKGVTAEYFVAVEDSSKL